MRIAGTGETGTGAEAWRGSAALDITRTVSRLHLAAPTGIDRVETAYLNWLRERGSLGNFLIRDGSRLLQLGREGGEAVLAQGNRARLDFPGVISRRPESVRRALSLARRLAINSTSARAPAEQKLANLSNRIVFNLGHSNLSSPVITSLKGAGAISVVMLHDTIPLDHPEYCRPETPERFLRSFHAACLADLVIANSDATAARVIYWADSLEITPPRIETIPLGIDPPKLRARPTDPPYFVVLGTIEPRKDHALLLDVWEALGPEAPQLKIIGRRGWGIEALSRRLDALPADGPVRELGPLTDAESAPLLAGARALLMPSRAEGFGLPVAEALAMGIPVIASDLPALRQVSGDAALHLPAGDVAAWKAKILFFLDVDWSSGQSLINRTKTHRAISWGQHFSKIERILTQMCRSFEA